MQLSTRLLGTTSCLGAIMACPAPASAALPTEATVPSADAPQALPPSDAAGDIVVTAQKREQRINDVGMSITAVSGDALIKQGVQDPTMLTKLVPGFVHNTTVFGNPIYSIRGIGFQDSTLGASPTVTVYADEVPIPFSAEANGVMLDLSRVEVLKGPQGTLYGQNATGGALNFITAKPSDSFEAGGNASFGRFSTADADGFISGPLSSTLNARISARAVSSSDWQKSYTRSDTLGEQHLLQGRIALDWRPTSDLRVGLTLNAWLDRSESAAPQLIGIVGLGTGGFNPALNTYPNAPTNNRAADWDANRDYQRNNRFYMGALRFDYDVSDAVTLTSISSLQRYRRDQPIEADGTALEDLFLTSFGKIDSFYQEARLAARFDRGNLIVGVNYGSDKIRDDFFQEFADSSSRLIFGTLPLTESIINTTQKVDTYAAYASGEFELSDTLRLEGGIRYTKSDRTFEGCGRDSNGQLAAVYTVLQTLFAPPGSPPRPPVPPGGCTTLNPVTFLPELARLSLKEDNIAWRLGLNWKVTPDTLLYANVSRGYKAGSYPTLAASTSNQYAPVKQESLLAFEAGFKAALAPRLQLNAAAFYYDYTDKQILGRVPVPPFGPLLTLVNVPKSHIIGAEGEINWGPMDGLTLKANATYIHSKIDDNFTNYDSFGSLLSFDGEAFPYTPKFQATVDAEYDWRLNDRLSAFLGANLSHHSETKGALGARTTTNAALYKLLTIAPYSLLDLRAGVAAASGAWRLTVWGRNVTNKYYWVTAIRDNDTINRYTGMPATYGVTLNFSIK